MWDNVIRGKVNWKVPVPVMLHEEVYGQGHVEHVNAL